MENCRPKFLFFFIITVFISLSSFITFLAIGHNEDVLMMNDTVASNKNKDYLIPSLGIENIEEYNRFTDFLIRSTTSYHTRYNKAINQGLSKATVVSRLGREKISKNVGIKGICESNKLRKKGNIETEGPNINVHSILSRNLECSKDKNIETVIMSDIKQLYKLIKACYFADVTGSFEEYEYLKNEILSYIHDRYYECFKTRLNYIEFDGSFYSAYYFCISSYEEAMLDVCLVVDCEEKYGRVELI